jgi:hypothetical protein
MDTPKSPPPNRLIRLRDAIRKPFRRQIVRTLPLYFTLDRSPDGCHLVYVSICTDDKVLPVTDPRALSHYGYREVVETPEEVITYVLDSTDLETLLALQSMNPQQSEDGGLLFDFAPPILLHLRQNNRVRETETSRQIGVASEPLRPGANIDFDPAEGVTIRTGYHPPGSEELLTESELRKTRDGRFAWLGSTIFPIKPPTGSVAAEWLRRPIHRVPIADVPEFYVRDLAPLRKELAAVLTDRVREIRVLDEPLKPIVYLDQTEKGWLSFQVGYQLGNRTLTHSQLSSVSERSFVRLDDKTWARIDARSLQTADAKLRKLGAMPTSGGGYRVPAAEFATLEEFVDSMGGRPIINDRYQAFIDQLTSFRADNTFRLSATAEADLVTRKVSLRPYQRAGIHWLTWLHDNGLHGLLADDMGLGKTLQSILTLRYAYEISSSLLPSLIVAPASVLHHWEREMERFYPEMAIYRYHGLGRSLQPLKSARQVVVISTFDTIRASIEELAKIPFFYVVLDEATNIKNPTSRRAKAVKALNSAHRLSLSGTPVENRPAELWSIYDFLMSGHLGPYGAFESLFENRIIAGDNVAAERLGRRIRPFMLRRLKTDLDLQLPDKIPMDEWCALTPEQVELYNQIQAIAEPVLAALRGGGRVDYAGSILPILTKLKQVCDHPAIVNKVNRPLAGRSEKFDWIVEKVQSIVDSGEQVLIFSQFLGMLDLLESAVEKLGIPTIRIDGATTNRQGLIDHFNAGGAKVGLFSLRAAGHGINVTAANHVIHADRWWNPAVENQATDRVHRIGQTKIVYVYRIMIENTLEERIEKLLRSKQQIADTIINAARQKEQQWTREELLEILRPLE